MLLMPNTSGSSTRGGPPRPYSSLMPEIDRQLLPPSAMLAATHPLRPPLNWASVASWFFRPESSPLTTTMANSLEQAACSRPPSNILIPTTSTVTKPPSPGPHTRERVFQPPTICTAIRCTVPGCNCECFMPGKRHLRYCETCKHGWVPHALDKLGTRHLFTNSAPEPVQPNAAFDIASLVLYGCQALPIRLKILLDRLFSVLQKEQVLQVLHGFGWTPEDYARGYILQESHGSSLDRWSICSPEEEPLVLQQFLRFGETRAITQQLLLAQQVLQEPTLERLERLSSPNSRRAMSPSRRPSSPTIPSAFHPSRLPTMSPHQKHPLSFLKLPPTNGPVTTSPSRSMTSSPLNTSPLNRLQNMQPFDFRKLGAGLGTFPTRLSPDLSSRRRTSESDQPVGLNLTMSTSLPTCLPPPPPPPISSSLNHSAAAMAAAVSVNSLAAASLVASSFPGLINTKMATGSRSPSTSDLLSNSGHTDFASEEDEDMDENSHSVLNLSRDKDVLKPPKHTRSVPGRKSTTPTKRHWGSPNLPLNLGTQFINPATGKKRVQCNVCLKTFCDKGALKIHFSAVHLREMHKCTVEGCNMMFSSRRSRNRHSANPNPKLHSPHLRRKISPHDGRSAQAHPILIPPQPGLTLPAAAAALNPLNPFSPFPLLTPPPDMRHHSALATMDFKHSLDLSVQRHFEDRNNSSDYNSMPLSISHHEDEEDDDDDGIVVVGGDEDEEPEKADTSNGISDQPEDFSMPSKRLKMSISDADEDIVSNVDSNEDSLSVVDTHSLKDECSLPTNKRKRKSQNPTRCTIPMMMDDTVSDGESSNDVFADPIQPKKERELEVVIKQEEVKSTDSKNGKPASPKCESPLDLGKRSSVPDVNANEPEKSEIKTSLAPLFMLDKVKKEKHTSEMEMAEEPEERPASSVESNKSDESFDCSNALRHLESLSHGHFGDLMSRGLHLGLAGQSPQFPPLGFMMGGGPPSPARSQASSAGSSNGGESPDENSQNQLFGHFDNGQFISTMDVPIDKDNPRRCTACGKIFQNHFGVKTHYQNVHLKLMHKCNVDGCNAAFPSKRSRDRHSANLNLHRKLLSTSSEKSAASLFMDKSPFASLAGHPALHNDLFARLYAEEAFKGHSHLHSPATLEQLMLNGDRLPPPPLLLPPLAGLPFPLGSFTPFTQMNGSSVSSRKDRSSSSNSPLSTSSPPPTLPPTISSPGLVHCVEEDIPSLDKDGNLPCRMCRSSFSGVSQLKEHCEKHHLFEMHKCTVNGCPKVFLSKTKRNIHAENESLHQDIIRKGFESTVS
ncbi:PREDICTED: zinc finger protein basonuclin-2-like isoform X2 [Nicrophorus vespilloides]|uniref:Zinc finger protein basonuclin-2-like isoform X2 n=1 Tax=Nicrophorus vespilloides TaxID=110193 RepID=A0ABM1NBS1_NICVS|nr:PREDICTED: zinc finger protein basonuclin-2-like isoform X2 [Nicrophorus vespilloides]